MHGADVRGRKTEVSSGSSQLAGFGATWDLEGPATFRQGTTKRAPPGRKSTFPSMPSREENPLFPPSPIPRHSGSSRVDQLWAEELDVLENSDGTEAASSVSFRPRRVSPIWVNNAGNVMTMMRRSRRNDRSFV